MKKLTVLKNKFTPIVVVVVVVVRVLKLCTNNRWTVKHPSYREQIVMPNEFLEYANSDEKFFVFVAREKYQKIVRISIWLQPFLIIIRST